MLQSLELSSLENRRSSNRLIFINKVVEVLVPAIPPNEFLKPSRQKRQVKVEFSKIVKQKTINTFWTGTYQIITEVLSSNMVKLSN